MPRVQDRLLTGRRARNGRTGTENEDQRDEEEGDDEEPRKKPATDEEESNNRDFEPGYFDDKPRKRRRIDEDDSLSPAEKAKQRAAFTRGAWGCDSSGSRTSCS